MNRKMKDFVLTNPMQKSANLVTIKCIFDEIDYYTENVYVHPLEETGAIAHILWVMDIKNMFHEKFKQTGTFGLIESYSHGFEVVNFLFRKFNETERDYEIRMEEWADNLDIEMNFSSFLSFKERFTTLYKNNN